MASGGNGLSGVRPTAGRSGVESSPDVANAEERT